MTKINKKILSIISITLLAAFLVFSSVILSACGDKKDQPELPPEPTVQYTVVNKLADTANEYVAIVLNFKNETQETKNYACVDFYIYNNAFGINPSSRQTMCKRFYTDTTSSQSYITFSLEADEERTVILAFDNVTFGATPQNFELFCKGEKISNVNIET